MTLRNAAVSAALVALFVLTPSSAPAAPCIGTATSYCPNESVTHLQIAAFLYRLTFPWDYDVMDRESVPAAEEDGKAREA